MWLRRYIVDPTTVMAMLRLLTVNSHNSSGNVCLTRDLIPRPASRSLAGRWDTAAATAWRVGIERRGNYGSQSAAPAPLLAKCCTTQAQPITNRVRKISADREEIVNKNGQVNSLVHRYYYLFVFFIVILTHVRGWRGLFKIKR